MNTKLIKIDPGTDLKPQLAGAAALIREGQLVAFPTETVYGLGADAMNEKAAARIYGAKGRPSDNPLIVHICDLDQVSMLAEDVPDTAWAVMKHFWPGPLTVILKKRKQVPDQTTGGLSTVAIRMPSHPVARELIRESGTVIAAPSANRSGRPSPTEAGHVFEDMNGRIPMILDGGTVGIGIESTIIDLSGNVPMLLRPVYISREELAALAGDVLVDPAIAGKEKPEHVVARAPGMKYRHYAPRGQLTLLEGPEALVLARIKELAREKEQMGFKVGVITTDETKGSYQDCHFDYTRSIGSRAEPETIAAALYDVLRDCDLHDLDYIYSESFFDEQMGDAIMNRLLKAAGYHLISLQDRT